MTYLELARKIKSAYKELKQDEVYKLFNIIWNNDLGESEITVENDAGFRAIIIGNTSGVKKSRGYTNRRQHMQLTKEITKVIDNFLHEKGIYGVDCDDLKHKIAETINGKER